MLKEFVIEPDLLVAWARSDRDAEEFKVSFGIGTPRILSSFPKSKVSKLRSYLLTKTPGADHEQCFRRYNEMVVQLVEALVLRAPGEVLGAKWTDDVLAEDAREEFGAIISQERLSSPRSLPLQDMYQRKPLYNLEDQVLVKRTYDSVAPHLLNLVRFSTHKIIFVDPYCFKNESIAFITKLLNDALTKRLFPDLPEIELLYKNIRGGNNTRETPKASYVREKLVASLDHPEQYPAIRCKELLKIDDGDVVHNRFILSDQGGIHWGYGCDLTENPAHSDLIQLLRKQPFETLWRKFDPVGDANLVSTAE